MSLLNLDPRWRRLNGPDFGGVFDIGYDHPDSWPHAARGDSGAEVVEVAGDKLSADLCRIDDHRFMRCTLPLPIRGSDEVFCFGPWAGVSRQDFDAYVAAWQAGNWSEFSRCAAWLMNDLPGFDSEDPIACDLRVTAPDARPQLFAQDGPLAQAQAEGISFDQLLDIYAATGTDIRSHLKG